MLLFKIPGLCTARRTGPWLWRQCPVTRPTGLQGWEPSADLARRKVLTRLKYQPATQVGHLSAEAEGHPRVGEAAGGTRTLSESPARRARLQGLVYTKGPDMVVTSLGLPTLACDAHDQLGTSNATPGLWGRGSSAL